VFYAKRPDVGSDFGLMTLGIPFGQGTLKRMMIDVSFTFRTLVAVGDPAWDPAPITLAIGYFPGEDGSNNLDPSTHPNLDWLYVESFTPWMHPVYPGTGTDLIEFFQGGTDSPRDVHGQRVVETGGQLYFWWGQTDPGTLPAVNVSMWFTCRTLMNLT
jgi:hypothetical protein